jgi:hypothetical protein
MDAATIPAPIVALGQQFAEDLWGWVRRHRRATLAAHEQGVLALVRRLLGPALGAALAVALGLDRPVARRLTEPCPDCGTRRKPHAWRKRQLLTVCGAVRLGRPYYYCAPCRRGWSPTDETLGLGAYEALSPGCAAWLARAGALVPFREAAALLEELTEIGVGAETVRTHAEAAGGLLDLCRRAAAEQVERAPPVSTLRSGERPAFGRFGGRPRSPGNADRLLPSYPESVGVRPLDLR